MLYLELPILDFPAFAHASDVCSVSAETAFTLNLEEDPKKLNTHNFMNMLVKSLIKPHLATRSLTALTMALLTDIKTELQWVDAEETAGAQIKADASQSSTSNPLYSAKSEIRKQCFFRVSRVYGPGYKQSNEKC